MAKYKAVIFVAGILLCAFCCGLVPEREAKASSVTSGDAATTEIKIEYVFASYKGDPVVVGDKIDESKISLFVVYSDGTSGEVKSGYVLPDSTVKNVGENKLLVFYRGKQATISVIGKEVVSLSAYTSRQNVSLGNGIDESDLTVTAYYNDGSSEEVKDYKIAGNIAQKLGLQDVTIIYKNKICTVSIYGTEERTPVSLYAEFLGQEQVAGSKINKRDIVVMAIYSNSDTEKVTTYTLSDVPNQVGEQTVNVFYRNVKTTIKVKCIERVPISITAKYVGKPVVIGREADKKDIIVTATFNSGETADVTDYTMYSRTVSLVGDNFLRVHYGDQQAEFAVEGIEVEVVTFDYGTDFTVSRNSNKATGRIALPKNIDTTAITGKNLKESKVKRVVRKIKGVKEYIPFVIKFVDDKAEDELPLTMRIKVPDAYVLSDTILYFTPNRKSILAALNTEVVDMTTLQVTINYAGTYILAYVPSVEPVADEDDE